MFPEIRTEEACACVLGSTSTLFTIIGGLLEHCALASEAYGLPACWSEPPVVGEVVRGRSVSRQSIAVDFTRLLIMISDRE
jgi:hypothetical protein